MYKQTPNAIMLVEPLHFGFNEETALSNVFQKAEGKQNKAAIRKAAAREFDGFVKSLRKEGVEVIVFTPTDGVETTDEIFPNNWVSFHEDGKVVIYPMLAPSRRLERRMDFITALDKVHGFIINEILDLSHHEQHGVYLEGTGSMVFDYVNKVSYANISPRTDAGLLQNTLEILRFRNCQFRAVDDQGQDIYHTNVLMCVGSTFAVVCLEAVEDLDHSRKLKQSLMDTAHDIIEISYDQMCCFAGNMMEVADGQGRSLLVMSRMAYQSLNQGQKKRLGKHSRIISIPIDTIENYGGGSVRCMMAGIFLPRNR